MWIKAYCAGSARCTGATHTPLRCASYLPLARSAYFIEPGTGTCKLTPGAWAAVVRAGPGPGGARDGPQPAPRTARPLELDLRAGWAAEGHMNRHDGPGIGRKLESRFGTVGRPVGFGPRVPLAPPTRVRVGSPRAPPLQATLQVGSPLQAPLQVGSPLQATLQVGSPLQATLGVPVASTEPRALPVTLACRQRLGSVEVGRPISGFLADSDSTGPGLPDRSRCARADSDPRQDRPPPPRARRGLEWPAGTPRPLPHMPSLGVSTARTVVRGPAHSPTSQLFHCAMTQPPGSAGRSLSNHGPPTAEK